MFPCACHRITPVHVPALQVHDAAEMVARNLSPMRERGASSFRASRDSQDHEHHEHSIFRRISRSARSGSANASKMGRAREPVVRRDSKQFGVAAALHAVAVAEAKESEVL